MRRRHFLQKAGLGLLASLPVMPAFKMSTSDMRAWHKPPRLRPGATVALIAPASPVSEEKLEKALSNMTNLGFRVKEGASLRARHGYLAGTDEARLADLHRAFADPEVEAVWCARGGYGITRLLPYIDYTLIKKNPKLFIGFSDVTALHMAIGQKTGLTTFHGPVAASDFPENTLTHFKSVLMEPAAPYIIVAPGEQAELPGEEYRPFTIAPGRASGPLTGGNLSLLAALAGTSFEPSFRRKIVFIEEVGEQPYRVDRLLTQLLQATDLQHAAGIVLGVFAECTAKNPEYSFTLPETLHERLGSLGIPIFYGLPFGHVAHQATFPYNVKAEMDTDGWTLTLLEAGVV